MIRHTVAFKLIHPHNSPGERAFLEAIVRLSSIPGVTNLQLSRQTSPGSNFHYGLSMEFAGAKEYEDYNRHPDHVLFVSTYWVNEVSDFLELDYEPMI